MRPSRRRNIQQPQETPTEGEPQEKTQKPGELVAEHPDTVAVVCDGTSLGVEFADGASHERIDAAEIRFGGRTAASCAVLGPYP